MIRCCSLEPGCSSQVRRSTACPLGGTCVRIRSECPSTTALRNISVGFLLTSKLPGPAKERGRSTSHSHDPGEKDSNCSVSASELEAAHRFADDDVPLDGQDHQWPESNFTCRKKVTKSYQFTSGPQRTSEHTKELLAISFWPPSVAMNPSTAQAVAPRMK